jgi:formyltetrahydrofolate deformylase
MQKITVLIHCEDQRNIIASVTNYTGLDWNIIYLDQHVDADENVFFMRLECEFNSANWDIESIKTNFNSQIAEKFNMSWEIYTRV